MWRGSAWRRRRKFRNLIRSRFARARQWRGRIRKFGWSGEWRRRFQRGSYRCCHTCRRCAASQQAVPIRWRRRNIPDICGRFEFDADLEKFPRACGRMDRFYKGANDGRDGLSVRLEDAKANRRADGIFMARRIAAAMKIEADCRSFFLKGHSRSGLAEHDERNRTLDARTAASFQAGERMKMIRGSG